MNTLFDISNSLRTLSDDELIYNVVKSDTKLKQVNNIIEQDIPSFDDILDILSPKKRAFAQYIIELQRRVAYKKSSAVRILSSNDTFRYMQPLMQALPNEEAWIICLNQCSKVIKRVRVNSGGYTSTLVDIRMCLYELIKARAIACILIHNHPSGNVRPSNDDNRLTDRLKQALSTVNIKLLDHLIISDSHYYSYNDEGLI